MFSVLVIRLRSLRLLGVSGIVMRLRMFLLLITFLKASHSCRNRLLVICKNAYLFATMIMTSVSSPFSCCSFFFQAEDGIRDVAVTGVQTCALPIYRPRILLREHRTHPRIIQRYACTSWHLTRRVGGRSNDGATWICRFDGRVFYRSVASASGLESCA